MATPISNSNSDDDLESLDDKEVPLQDEIRQEVESLIHQRSAHWLALEDRLMRRFREYSALLSEKSAIYRLYSRSDKQTGPHPHLKDISKIIEEIQLRRHGGHRFRNGKSEKVEPDPTFSIYDVTDIVGITIVCPFPSDVEVVINTIKRDAKANNFYIKLEKYHNRAEYEAVHFVLSMDDEPLDDLTAEVQVRTAFQDALSWRVHSLTYKGDHRTDPWYVDQVSRINTVIRAVDGMSDELRVKLAREAELGASRRNQAKNQLRLSNLEGAHRVENPILAAELTRLAAVLDQSPRPMPADSLRTVRRQIENLIEHHGINQDTYRIAALFAIGSGRSDKLFWIDDLIDLWFRTNDIIDEKSAKCFHDMAVIRSIAHYCAGDLTNTLRFGEVDLRRLAQSEGYWSVRLASNLAYFYAEGYSELGIDAFSRRALKLSSQVRREMGESISEAHKDTIGYVLIQAGQTLEEIEHGLEICRQAYQSTVENDLDDHRKAVAEKFFTLHREIAYKRLAKIARSDA